MKKKRLLHIDVETTGGFQGRVIWDIAWIVTDAKGNELYRAAYLVEEALPFLAADGFWGARKNDLLVQVLHKRTTEKAAFVFAEFQKALDDCEVWAAFNSGFEFSAFAQTVKAFRLPVLNMPQELDLALATMDILNFGQYAIWALEKGYTTPKGNISAKCEYVLEWLGFDPKGHCHLALEDTETQLALFKILKSKRKKFPEFGKRICYPSHPAWLKYLKVTPSNENHHSGTPSPK